MAQTPSTNHLGTGLNIFQQKTRGVILEKKSPSADLSVITPEDLSKIVNTACCLCMISVVFDVCFFSSQFYLLYYLYLEFRLQYTDVQVLLLNRGEGTIYHIYASFP